MEFSDSPLLRSKVPSNGNEGSHLGEFTVVSSVIEGEVDQALAGKIATGLISRYWGRGKLTRAPFLKTFRLSPKGPLPI